LLIGLKCLPIFSMGRCVATRWLKMSFSFRRQQQHWVQQSSQRFHFANDSKELTGNGLVSAVCMSASVYDMCFCMCINLSICVWIWIVYDEFVVETNRLYMELEMEKKWCWYGNCWSVGYRSNIVYLVFYFVTVSEKKWQYDFQMAKEMPVLHTSPCQPTSSTGCIVYCLCVILLICLILLIPYQYIHYMFNVQV